MREGVKLFVLMLIMVSCGEIEEVGFELPQTDSLTVENIKTVLPIININAEKEDLFYMMNLPGNKIFVKSTLDYISDDLTIRTKPITIRIKGAGSVLLPLKSLEIIFDSKENIGANLFENSTPSNIHYLSSLKSFRIRNSGQDFNKTMIKDKAYSKLAIDLELNFLPMFVGRSTQVFINSEYYGLLNIRSESNLNGVAEILNTNQDNLVIYKVDAKNGNIEYNEGNYSLTDDLEEAIDRGSSEELMKMIDVNSFIDYIIYEDYIGNTDWPHNNIRMFSHKGGPFKFIFYDSDHAARKTKNALLPELEYVSHDLGKIYRAFRKVEGFDEKLNERQKFIYEKLTSTSFDLIVDEMAHEIESDILYQISKYKSIDSPYQWKWNLGKLKRDFEMRDIYIRDKYDL